MVEQTDRLVTMRKRKSLPQGRTLKKNETSQKIISVLSVFGIILTVVLAYLAYKKGLFTDPKALEAFLHEMGPGGPYLFIVIQIIQTVIPIISGALTCPAGALIFGNLMGFVYNLIGIMIGSVLNFFLARYYGKPLVQALTSPKTYDKYIGWLDRGKTFDRLFAFGMFFPLSPADFLCLMAGLSKMSFRKFFVILSLGKPLTLFLYTYGITEVLKAIGKLFI